MGSPWVAARALEAGFAAPRRPGVQRRVGFDATSAARLLALQHAAGNRAVTASLQRAPAAAARAPKAVPGGAAAPANERNDYIDLLNGFGELAVSAVNNGGRTLDTIRFGTDLSSAHRSFLENVRRVLILAQDQSPDARRTAAAQWPRLAATLRADLVHARQLGLPTDQLSAVADNLALVGEKYVHAPHPGASEAENGEDYKDLMDGIQRLVAVVHQSIVDKRDAVVPLNIGEINARQRSAIGAVQFGTHLSRRHRELLESLRKALVLARTESPGSARQALAAWQSVQGDLRHAFKRAPTYVEGDVGAIARELGQIGVQLIHGGVYQEAHVKAVRETNLRAPDLAFQVERFKEAARSIEEVKKLAEKGLQLTGENAVDVMLSEGKFEPGMAHAIFELVHNPGEIAEKLEEFKKKDVIGKAVTVADIADKAQGMARALGEVSCEVIKRFAEKAKDVAIKAGEKELAEHWEKIAKWAEGKLGFLKTVAKVAAVISFVISAVKVIDYLRQGKWAEALEEAGETVAGLAAGAAGGAGGAAMVGGIAVVIAAEIEGLHGAAAMIRYCNKANIREAAGDFTDICVSAADIEARDLVADAKLLADASMNSERKLIEERLEGYRPYWMRHLDGLSELVRRDRVNAIGGQPALRDALGSETLRVLANPATWTGSWQSMAEQIRIVFAGANEMAKYAVEHYPRSEKKEEEGETKEGGE
jgi:hypothetical protein